MTQEELEAAWEREYYPVDDLDVLDVDPESPFDGPLPSYQSAWKTKDFQEDIHEISLVVVRAPSGYFILHAP